MRVSISDEQLRAAFDAVADDPSFRESRALVARGLRPVEMVQAMALRPEILATLGVMGHSIYPGGILERSIKEYVIVEASRLNACQFCRDSHLSIARMAGVSADALASLADPGSLAERERLAVEYTRSALADSNRVPDDLFARLKAAFTDPEIVELTMLIGYITMLNVFNNCLQVTYRGEYEAAGLDGRP